MKQSILLLFSLCGTLAFGQKGFVAGYFVTKDGQRTDCQVRIRSDGKRDCPKSFDYRTGEGSEARSADLENTTELGLASGAVFRRISVEMDRSPDNLSRIDKNIQTSQLRNPIFASETLFLRLVLSGPATLYQYDEGNLHRFFYTVDDSPVKQLVYKKYFVRTESENPLDPNRGKLQMGVNEDYKQQLLNDLVCASLERKELESLTYDANKLKKLFAKYNECRAAK